ncbi:hypothetical protein JT359_17485 [Candidatus Poribacteria bacterium]|nr:hypothetical protein [Candidatus Poribacteria bacterium]
MILALLFYPMRYFNISLILLLFSFQVHGVTLKTEFQLGEKQQPTLDRLLPDVASRLTFNEENTKLIAHQMDGNIVEWDMHTFQKRLICTVEEDQWSTYSPRLNYLLIPKADGIAVIDVANRKEIQLVKNKYEIRGPYESGCYSPDAGRLVALTKGDNEFEAWRFSIIGIATGIKSLTIKPGIKTTKILDYKTQLPVRNGIAIAEGNSYLATAEGTYRDGEGHRTIIEIWSELQDKPYRVFDTGEVLGVWNLVFSDYGMMLAVDTQLNGKSGIRVWEIRTGRQVLNKSGFEAYWVRALAFAPNKQKLSSNDRTENLRMKGYLHIDYLASGDEKGNLRVWGIPYHTSKILDTKSVIWETYPTGIQTLAFSPNGNYLAVALWDTTIQILRWNSNE